MSVEKTRVAELRAAFILTLLCVMTGVRALRISGFGVPSAVQADESVELSCEYELQPSELEKDLIVKWWWRPLHTPGGDQTGRQLYQRIGNNKPQPVRPNISVKQNDTILIHNMQPQDSGTYECEVAEFAGSEDRRHKNLIVFTEGSGPELNVSLVADGADEDDEEDVLVECSAEEVAPMPELAITVDGAPIKVVQWLSEPESGFYNVSANATLTKERAHGAEITCELFFTDETISHPAYNDNLVYQVPGAEPTPDDEPELETPENNNMTTESPAELTDGASCTLASLLLLSVVLSMHYYV